MALIERRLDYDDLSDFLGSWNSQQRADRLRAGAAPRTSSATGRSCAARRSTAPTRCASGPWPSCASTSRIRDLDISLAVTSSSGTRAPRWPPTPCARSRTAWPPGSSPRTRDLSDTEQRNAIISGATILVLLLLVLVITTRVAGSLVRPLRRLRAEALQVATTRLPETVRLLRESGDRAEVPEVPSVGVNTRDEIGEVARAFDEVHREAIRLAGDEAKLRAQRQLDVRQPLPAQPDARRAAAAASSRPGAGRGGRGPAGSLFRLDHLATRMRRNSENLLVLAGQEPARKWSEPVPLVDVARASLSEVENYERVQIQIPSGIGSPARPSPTPSTCSPS